MALLEARKINKHFGGLVAVDSFDITVDRGEIVGLIGPNGAGKTTVFNMLAGFYRPDSGDVLFNEKSIVGMKMHKICELGIARTFQVTKPFGDITVLQNIMVGAFARSMSTKEARQKALKVIETVEFQEQQHMLGSELTTADHKRLELARALATDPKLLLLDEPMAGLTPTEKRHLLDTFRNIRDMGVTLIVVEHDMKAVMTLCERITMLDRGKKIVEGAPEAVAKDPLAISAYLGDEYVAT